MVDVPKDRGKDARRKYSAWDEDDEAHEAGSGDPIADELAARGIYKGDHRPKPYEEYMEEPDFDRW